MDASNKNTPTTRAVVVDLDGTLLAGNSLKMFVPFVAGRLLRRGHLLSLAAVLAVLLLRKLHLITHRRMKFVVISRASRHLTAADYDAFRQCLHSHLNDDVVRLLHDEHTRGVVVILATAADASYLRGFETGLPIDVILATGPAPRLSEYTECRGRRKLAAVARHLAERRLALAMVITDHHDDMPLLLAGAPTNILVSPTASTLMSLNAAGIPYTLFPSND